MLVQADREEREGWEDDETDGWAPGEEREKREKENKTKKRMPFDEEEDGERDARISCDTRTQTGRE